MCWLFCAVRRSETSCLSLWLSMVLDHPGSALYWTLVHSSKSGYTAYHSGWFSTLFLHSSNWSFSYKYIHSAIFFAQLCRKAVSTPFTTWLCLDFATGHSHRSSELMSLGETPDTWCRQTHGRIMSFSSLQTFNTRLSLNWLEEKSRSSDWFHRDKTKTCGGVKCFEWDGDHAESWYTIKHNLKPLVARLQMADTPGSWFKGMYVEQPNSVLKCALKLRAKFIIPPNTHKLSFTLLT